MNNKTKSKEVNKFELSKIQVPINKENIMDLEISTKDTNLTVPSKTYNSEFKKIPDGKYLFFKIKKISSIDRNCTIKLIYNHFYFLGFRIFTKIDKYIKIGD